MTTLRAALLPLAVWLGAMAAPAASDGSVPAAIDARTDRAVRPAGAETPTTIVVDNASWRDVIVWTLQSGIRVRLGRVTALGTKEFEVTCQRFMNRRTDFLLRQLGSSRGRLLRGAPLSSCDQQIVIRIFPNGLQHATLFLR